MFQSVPPFEIRGCNHEPPSLGTTFTVLDCADTVLECCSCSCVYCGSDLDKKKIAAYLDRKAAIFSS